MQLLVIDNRSGVEKQYKLLSGARVFNLDDQATLRSIGKPPGLKIENTRGNVFVTDLGFKEAAQLATLPLPPQTPWLWQPNQELRAGPYILLWRPSSTRWSSGLTTERVSPLLVATLIGLFALGLVVLGLYLWSHQKSTLRVAEAPTAWLPKYFGNFPTPATATTTPPPTELALQVRRPSTITKGINPADNPPTSTPTPTATLSITETMKRMGAGALVNGTPVIDAHKLKPDPDRWDPRLDQLGVNYVPAVVAIGGQFWRLVEAKWLDEQAAVGTHHVFVEVLDEQGNRVLEPVTMSMTWTSGSCKRYMENTPPLQIGPQQIRPYGMNCPMYNAGYVYKVKVGGFGLPSDEVQNLGLGTIEQRTWGIRTSFLLIFQRAKRLP